MGEGIWLRETWPVHGDGHILAGGVTGEEGKVVRREGAGKSGGMRWAKQKSLDGGW